MKNIMLVILVFISTCCFAMDEKLIDGVKRYDTAVKNLEEIVSSLKAQGYLGLWSFEGYGLSNPDHIDEKNEQTHDLVVRYNEAKKEVEKYAPIKNEYNRQVARKEEIKDTILNTIITLIILSIITLFIWFIISRHKKYKRLLAEGKITQQEYDRMTQCNKPYTYDDCDTNPATGLRMIGGVDSGGNPRGCSFKSSSSTFDYSQDHRDRHRWDHKY